jgi:hypothetical protein
MKNFFFLLIIVGVIVGMWQYTLPLWATIQKKNATVASLENIIAKAEDVQKRRDEILELYKNISDEDRRSLEVMFPENLKQEDLYIFFKTIIEKIGVPLTNISIAQGAAPGKDKGATNQKSLSFSIETEGSYDELRSLLDTLENSNRLMDIVSIDIGKVSKEQSNQVYKISLKGNMYYAN